MEFVYIKPGTFMMGSPSGESGRDRANVKNCGDDCPVENVSWNDVQKFIKKFNSREGSGKYRLPTEAEWEYACRAGSTARFCFGNNADSLGNYAWYYNSVGKTHPVAQRNPNAWGLYDMHGNVWEWCQDWKGNYPSGSVIDPKGHSSGSGRVFRGGSWRCAAGGCRSAFHSSLSPGGSDAGLGFRLSRTQ